MKINTLLFTFLLFLFQNCNAQEQKDTVTYTPYSDLNIIGKEKPIDLIITKDYALHKLAATDFERMKKAAWEEDSIKLYICSSFRSMDYQAKIWNKKFTKFIEKEKLTPKQAFDKVLEYSALPGTSRHHWGTEVDLIDINRPVIIDPLDSKNFESGGNFEKMYKWLQNNANLYGFYEVYPKKDSLDTLIGVKFEPWHYSYLPLANKYYSQLLAINHLQTYYQTSNLLGKEFITDDFLKSYFEHFVKLKESKQ